MNFAEYIELRRANIKRALIARRCLKGEKPGDCQRLRGKLRGMLVIIDDMERHYPFLGIGCNDTRYMRRFRAARERERVAKEIAEMVAA